MPITDGLEACAELRNLDPDARVIICSRNEGAVQREARESAAQLLVSPFQKAGVLASVERALE
jgi:CheY-like chemotaxis protein